MKAENTSLRSLWRSSVTWPVIDALSEDRFVGIHGLRLVEARHDVGQRHEVKLRIV